MKTVNGIDKTIVDYENINPIAQGNVYVYIQKCNAFKKKSSDP